MYNIVTYFITEAWEFHISRNLYLSSYSVKGEQDTLSGSALSSALDLMMILIFDYCPYL